MNAKDLSDTKLEKAKVDPARCEKDTSSEDRRHPADGDAIAEVGDAVGGPA